MKTAIVTGAGGFIGGAVTALLLDKGVTVYGVDVSEKFLERHRGRENFHPVIADFTRYGQLHESIPAGTDVFYHFAWQGVFGDAFRDHRLQLSNASYAADAASEAAKMGCKKFVFAGTYNELEVANHFDMSGKTPRYTCIYSASKAAAEIICKTIAANSGMEYSAGLTVMAYGEKNRSMMLPNVVMKQLLRGESPKLIKGDIPYDMIYIDDIARAFYAIGEAGVNLRSYYVGHRTLRTFREYLEEIGAIVAPEVPLMFGAYPDDNSSRNYDLIDREALYNDTGFECRADFNESIQKTAEWLKYEGEAGEMRITKNGNGGGYVVFVPVILRLILAAFSPKSESTMDSRR